jgi:hypothetical protein
MYGTMNIKIHIEGLGLDPMRGIGMMLFTTKFNTSLTPLITGASATLSNDVAGA